MQFIASSSIASSLSGNVLANTTVKDNQTEPAFYATTRLKKPAPRKQPARPSALLLSLVLIGGLISGTEAYLLITKTTSTTQTQLAEASDSQRSSEQVIR